MKKIIFIYCYLYSFELQGQSIIKDTMIAIEPFVCSFKCSNSFAHLKSNCITQNLPIRTTAIDSSNVNPYIEFKLIISALSKDEENPFPLLYTFRDCENVCNAASVMVDSLRYIYYNKDFLKKLKAPEEKHKWAVRAIISHEIGHHILEHTLPAGKNPLPEERRKRELQADYFSAFVIKQFPGSTLDYALSGLRSLDSNEYRPKNETEENGSDYPTFQKRAIAVTEGFMDDKDNPLRIAMFRQIDTIALRDYNRLGKSIIMHKIDEDISIGNWNGAKEKIDIFLKNNPNAFDSYNLNEFKKTIENFSTKGTNNNVSLDDIDLFNKGKEEIETLKKLYDKLKGGSRTEKIEAEKILNKIQVLEKQQYSPNEIPSPVPNLRRY